FDVASGCSAQNERCTSAASRCDGSTNAQPSAPSRRRMGSLAGTISANGARSALLAEPRHDVVDRVTDGVEIGEVFVVEGEADGAFADVFLERFHQLEEGE